MAIAIDGAAAGPSDTAAPRPSWGQCQDAPFVRCPCACPSVDPRAAGWSAGDSRAGWGRCAGVPLPAGGREKTLTAARSCFILVMIGRPVPLRGSPPGCILMTSGRSLASGGVNKLRWPPDWLFWWRAALLARHRTLWLCSSVAPGQPPKFRRQLAVLIYLRLLTALMTVCAGSVVPRRGGIKARDKMENE